MDKTETTVQIEKLPQHTKTDKPLIETQSAGMVKLSIHIEDTMKALFSLGQIYATPGAISALEQVGLLAGNLLSRHVAGDDGELCREDKQANRDALKTGARIFSSYKISDQLKIWIITEADRSATTLLLPEEY